MIVVLGGRPKNLVSEEDDSARFEILRSCLASPPQADGKSGCVYYKLRNRQRRSAIPYILGSAFQAFFSISVTVLPAVYVHRNTILILLFKKWWKLYNRRCYGAGCL
jgi:hypothetical protein